MKRDVAQRRADQQQTAPEFSSVLLLMSVAFNKSCFDHRSIINTEFYCEISIYWTSTVLSDKVFLKKKADLPALIVLQCLRCTSACLLPCGNCLSVLKNCSKCQNRPRTACPSVWEESFKTTSEVVRFCLCFVFLKLSIHAPKSWRVFKVWVTEFSSAMLLLFLYAHPQKSQPFP